MADQIIGLRADNWEWSAEVAGNDIGVFDQKEGGEIDSDDSVFRPGGMHAAYSLGGPVTVTNLILRRNYRKQRDHEKSRYYILAVGRYGAKITGQPLDHAGHAFGTPFIYLGKVKRVAFPTADGNSGEASMLEIEFTIDDVPTADAGDYPNAT